MKTQHLFLTVLFPVCMGILCLTIPAKAQVSINTDGSAPDNSAMLDVKSSNKGILFPRLSNDDRNSIASPGTGLLIYNTSTNFFNYYNGSQWSQVEISPSSSLTGLLHPGGGVSINEANSPADSSAMLDVNNASRGVLIPRTIPASVNTPAKGLIIFNNSTNLINYYNGTAWQELCSTSTVVSGGTGSQNSAGVSINNNGSVPHQSAILDISSNTKGLLIPRLTESQRNALLPVTGLTVYNLTSDKIEYFNGISWCSMKVSFLSPPAEGPHVPSPTQIEWHWNVVAGATGYKWNTANNYATAYDMGTSTTKTETGLACNTTYTRYTWAYDVCGNSNAVTLTQTTLAAQPVLFDFDNAPLYSSLPISQTAGGITAYLSATGQGYSIQNANALGFTPQGFAGHILYPNSINLSDLLISYDYILTDFSIMYACQELGCDDAATMRVTAYLNGNYVGTNTKIATNPGTWPVDTLSCSFPQGFTSVVVHYDSRPPTCQDYGVIYLADNMWITACQPTAVLKP